MVDESKPIAILGAGAAAQTMAVDLTLRNLDVILCEHPDFKKNFEPILNSGQIEIQGLLTGKPKIHEVTTNIQKTVQQADIINLVLPAIGHETFMKEMIPYLENGQIVVVWSGDGGSMRLAKLVHDLAPELNILIGETQSMPYGTRICGPAQVDLLLSLKQIMMAAFPAKRTGELISVMKRLFPNIIPADNVLACSLSNPNPTVHPPGSILSISRIQYSHGDFNLYKEGITEATARVVRDLYMETFNIAKAFGFQILTYEEEDFLSTGTIMSTEFWGPFDKLGVMAAIKGPSSLNDRYIVEDLPYGLVQRSQLGSLVEVPTPVIDGIISLGSSACGTNFWIGRTMEDLGLAGKSKEEIMEYLQEGYK